MKGRVVLGACLSALLIATAAPASLGAAAQKVAGLPRAARAGAALAPAEADAIASAAAATFPDTIGDSGSAVDIEEVFVSNLEGGTVGALLAGDFSTFDFTDVVEFYFDTDDNPATGAPNQAGAEYGVAIAGQGPGAAPLITLFRWTGTAWSSATPQLSLEVALQSDALAFVVDDSELGFPTSFNFWAVSLFPNNTSPSSIDFVPDAGTLHYDFDVTAPEINAFKAECKKPCKSGSKIDLVYQLKRQELTDDRIQVFRSGRSAPVATFTFPSDQKADGVSRFFVVWRVPAKPVGWYEFCVRATDLAGNTGPRDCGKIVFPKIDTDAQVLRRISSSGISVDRLFLEGLPKGTKVDVDCSCNIHEKRTVNRNFDSRVFKGRFIPNGAKITVRATHARWVGHYEQLTVGSGALGLKEKVRCMAPGTTKPSKRCS